MMSERLELDPSSAQGEYEPPPAGNNRARFKLPPWGSTIRNCLVEFTGDIIFIFIGILQGASGVPGTLVPALAHGITIFVLIAGMGHISGGHFNPAVTIGVMISGNLGIISALSYIISQLSGGFVGALLARAAAGNATYIDVLKGGVTVPAPGVYAMEAITCEGIFTYLLVLTVILTAVDSDSNSLAPLAIGLSIAVDILAGGGISGASMNPARSLGPALVYSMFGPEESTHWQLHYVYWVGPIIGSFIAAVMYKLFLARDGKRFLF